MLADDSVESKLQEEKNLERWGYALERPEE